MQDEVADRLVDRLEDCTRAFPRALILGGAAVQMLGAVRGRGGVQSAVVVDTSPAMLARVRADWDAQGAAAELPAEFVLADAAAETLPVDAAAFDGECRLP